MRRTMTKLMGVAAALLCTATLASAQLDTNNMTTVTFSAPVSLPGVTLPAGSYLFKLADSQVNRHIVQVFDKDRSKLYATILAIPAERNEPADETVITFAESPANMAPAIRYWYFPGQKRGQEFAYPKKQAQDIANAAHTSVLSVDTEDASAEALAKGNISRVEPGEPANQSAQGAQASTMTQSSTAPAPTTQPAEPQSAQATQPPSTAQSQTPTTEQPRTTPSARSSAPSTAATSASAQSNTQESVGTSGRTSLPKTASTLPLVGFMGLLSLASAFGVRTLRRARA